MRRWFLFCGLASFAVFVGIGVGVDQFGQRSAASQTPVIVVLGARVLPGGVASNSLKARVERAVALYREQPRALLIFSGGVGDHPPSEARVALKIAHGLGVPEEACLLEENSHSTEENARFTGKMLRERGIRQVLLVSDPYHLFRARQHFWRQGIDVICVPTLLAERNIKLRDRVFWTAREVVALLKQPSLFFARRPD